MAFELPPELWLKVFRLLPIQSLRNIRTVSSLFSDISCCFLFEKVLFCPAPLAIGHAADQRAMEQEFARVAFWSSEKITGYVRQCTVDLAHTRISVVSESAHPFVAACFEAVSKFRNLRHLSCRLSSLGPDIEMPALRVEELSSLKSLHIHSARLAPPTSESIRLKLEDFTYTYIPPLLSQGQTASSLPYLSFFDPSRLCRLHLTSLSMSGIDLFLADKVAMASFRNLRVLELGHVRVTTMAHLHACISPFPAVDDLTLDLDQCEVGPIPSTPLIPHLRAYKGSMAFIHGIDLRGTLLHTLALTKSDCDAGSLLRMLQMGGSTLSTSIAFLTVRVSFGDLTAGSVLRDTLLFFPNLQTLTMMVSSDLRLFRRALLAEPRSLIVERLVTILTVVPVLEEMVLDWQLWSRSWNNIIPSTKELETMLLPALPSLRHVSSKIGPG
ncbi:hypothetical protein K438DRAFT_1841268 [Mycena galopus ATCC 62051]|nr:hypothetical protein K438DRAFT_1841268 [Mycena galopus ATCC 62051]